MMKINSVECELNHAQTNQEGASLVRESEIGIPAIDWGLRVQREIDQTVTPERKQRLQELQKELWARTKLAGLYE